VKLGNAYLECYDSPIKGIWQGASQLQIKLLLKDEPIISSAQEEKNGREFTVDTYDDKALFYDESGILAAWLVKTPVLKENSLQLAYDAFLKAEELDAKKSSSKVLTESLKSLQSRFVNDAMSSYTLGNNKQASENFEKAWSIAANPLIGLVDSTMAYYTAVTASLAGEHARTIKFLEYCLSINYDQKGDVYATLADAYKLTGDTAKAKDLLSAGFTKYPSSQGILVALINVYLESNDNPEKVLGFLKVAQQNEPANPSLFYAEGNVYKKLGKLEDAIASFKKSAVVDAKYFFAPFSEGDAYYSLAVELQEKAQQELDDAKFAELQSKMEKALENAIDPFERAFTLTEDAELKAGCAEYLKQIYFRFRDKKPEYKAAYDKYIKFIEENKK
ncbi:MAG: hypothetical protein RR770_06490, partial [Bacteroidales bacterium]